MKVVSTVTKNHEQKCHVLSQKPKRLKKRARTTKNNYVHIVIRTVKLYQLITMFHSKFSRGIIITKESCVRSKVKIETLCTKGVVNLKSNGDKQYIHIAPCGDWWTGSGMSLEI